MTNTIISVSFLISFFCQNSAPHFLTAEHMQFQQLMLSLVQPLLFYIIFHKIYNAFEDFYKVFPAKCSDQDRFNYKKDKNNNLNTCIF
ncbi:hypothetical protein D3851_09670 [Streptococcus mutans]|uniref:hypothetical protein n=1 Tax=Streptococcus mutans TaxID=1309 RepID=UPI00047394F9|nr:hypothetical protein [Streptococcus mutans]